MAKLTNYTAINNSITATLQAADAKITTANAGLTTAKAAYTSAEEAKAAAAVSGDVDAYNTACTQLETAKHSIEFFEGQITSANNSKRAIQYNYDFTDVFGVTETAATTAKATVRTALRSIVDLVEQLKSEVDAEEDLLRGKGIRAESAINFKHCDEYALLERYLRHIKSHRDDFQALTGYSLDYYGNIIR